MKNILKLIKLFLVFSSKESRKEKTRLTIKETWLALYHKIKLEEGEEREFH